jgi:hypothetical protein
VQIEVGNELAQLNVRDFTLAHFAREVDVLQNVVEAGVAGLQAPESLVEKVSDIMVGIIQQEFVARLRRNPERAFLHVPVFQVGALNGLCLAQAGCHFLLEDLLAALIENIGAAFEEEHSEDVFLELGGVHLATENVSGFE